MVGEIKKRGGKMIGSEKILDHLCDIYQMQAPIPGSKESGTVKLWLAHKLNIPLKMEMSSVKNGKFMTLKAKELKTNISVSSNMFEVPKGYMVTDMQQMMNQLKDQNKR